MKICIFCVNAKRTCIITPNKGSEKCKKILDVVHTDEDSYRSTILVVQCTFGFIGDHSLDAYVYRIRKSMEYVPSVLKCLSMVDE